MRPTASRTLGAALLLAAGLYLQFGHLGTARSADQGELWAGVSDALADADRDGLPDMLEFVIDGKPDRSDSDGDGRSDFVELVDYSIPAKRDSSHNPLPDGFRVIVNTTEDGPDGPHVLWLHLLVRIRSGDPKDLTGLALFADIGGNRYPLTWLLGVAVKGVHTVSLPKQGLLVRTTLRIPLFYGFQYLGPVTFGAYAGIGGRVHSSGALLMATEGVYYTLLPKDGASSLDGTAVFQATSQTAEDTFWSKNRRCVFQLQVYGTGTSGKICEVKKATCETSNTRQCPPSCESMAGQTFFVPDGLPLILGG